MLWQHAYTELYFTDCLWPDFNEDELDLGIKHYLRTTRKFGAIEEYDIISERCNRIITGIILSVIFLAALFFLPLFYISFIFSIISLYGFYEWLKISGESSSSILFNLIMMIILMLLLIYYHSHSTVILLTYISLFIWIIIPFDMLYDSKLYKKLLKSKPSLVGLYMILSTWFLLISLGIHLKHLSLKTINIYFSQALILAYICIYFSLLP